MGLPSSQNRLMAADYPEDQQRLVNDLNSFLTSVNGLVGGSVSIDNMAAVVREFTVRMPARVTTPTLSGTWRTLYGPVGYSKSGGFVDLSGTITGGAYGNTAIFTLPVECRPEALTPLPAVQANETFTPTGLVLVYPSGAVVAPVVTSIQTGTSAWLSLNGLRFPAADAGQRSLGAPFPLSLSIGRLRVAKSVLVLSCYDVTSGTAVPAPLPTVTWAPLAGAVSIVALDGLAGGRSYTVRLEVRAY